jgi:hypothetical protein
MFTQETDSSRISDSKIKSAKVFGALQELKTIVNRPAPGSVVIATAAIPDRHEFLTLNTRGIDTIIVSISSNTTCYPEPTAWQSQTNAFVYIPQTDEGIARFESLWRSIEDVPGKNFERQTEVHSSPTFDRADALILTLPAEKLALLARIRAFRKKAGKLDFTINELIHEVREESA